MKVLRNQNPRSNLLDYRFPIPFFCFLNSNSVVMNKGSYLLLVEANDTVKIGALGELEFDGKYVYCGSALGPGGLSRVKRHFKTSKGEGNVHWHIDYLLRQGEVIEAYLFPGKDIECDLSDELDDPVHGFGASDCSCGSHLHTTENLEYVLEKREHRILRPED